MPTRSKVPQKPLTDLATLEMILEVGQSLITIRDLSVLLRKIVKSAGSILKADVVVLYEYHEDIDDVNVPPTIWGKVTQRRILTNRSLGKSHRDSIVFKVLRRTQPIYAPDAVSDWAKVIGAANLGKDAAGGFIQREGIASSAAVRLTAHKKTVGVLFVNYRLPHHFSDEDCRIIELFATQAAAAIQNARVMAGFDRQLRAHKALHEAGGKLVSAQTAGDILNVVATTAAHTLNCTHCTVLRLDDEGNLVVAAFEGNRGWSLPQGRLFPRGSGIAGWVAQENRSALVTNALRDPRFQQGWSTPQPDPLSLVVAPIVVEGKILGVISAEHDQPGAFDEHDQRLLETLSAQASIAIKNADSLINAETRTQRLERLHAILLGAMQTQDPEQVLPELVQTVNDILGQEASSVINLYDPDKREFHSHYAAGPEKEVLERELPRNNGGVSSEVVKTGVPLFIDDGIHSLFRRPEARGESIRSFACLPLRRGKTVLGTLYIRFDQKPHTFSDDEKWILELFADGASVAYQNARFFEQIRAERTERIKAIREIGFGITKGEDLKAILNDLLARTLDLMKKGSRGEILLIDPSGTKLLIEADQGDIEKDIKELPIDQGIVGWVAHSGKSYYTDDVQLDAHFVRRLAKTRSELAVPLLQSERLIGVLNVEHPLSSAFGKEDQELLEAIASQVVIAIENARLFNELKSLYEVGKEIAAALNWRQTLQLIAEKVHVLAEATRSLVLVVEEDTQKIVAKGVGYPEEYLANFTIEEMRDGVSGWVFDNNEPRLVEDALADEWNIGLAKKSAIKFDSKSLAVAPLHVKGKVIGTLTVVNTQDRPLFTEQTLQTVMRFADQAAIAIENARLYEELQERAEQLVRLQEVTASVLAESNAPDRVLKLIANSIAGVFGAFSCTIRLYDPISNTFGESTASEGSAKRPTHNPRSNGTTSYLLQTKHPIYGENALATLPNGKPTIRPENRAQGVEAAAYLPLLVGEELIGRLAVSWRTPRRFSENDKRMLDLFADQAAATIKMARLYSQLSEANLQLAEKNQQLDYLVNRKIRDLKAVYEVSQQLTSAVRMNEQDVLELIHRQTRDLMDTENMYIALYDKEEDIVRFGIAFVDGNRIDVKTHEDWQPRKGGKGRTEWIIRHRQPILIETRDESVEWYKEHEGIDYIKEPFASWIGVPMTAGDKVLGVIATYHKTQDYIYTRDDQEVLELMASQAAIVLQNARMWEAMQKLSEDLGAGAILDAE